VIVVSGGAPCGGVTVIDAESVLVNCRLSGLGVSDRMVAVFVNVPWTRGVTWIVTVLLIPTPTSPKSHVTSWSSAPQPAPAGPSTLPIANAAGSVSANVTADAMCGPRLTTVSWNVVGALTAVNCGTDCWKASSANWPTKPAAVATFGHC
jgi:hypothetical protein